MNMHNNNIRLFRTETGLTHPVADPDLQLGGGANYITGVWGGASNWIQGQSDDILLFQRLLS